MSGVHNHGNHGHHLHTHAHTKGASGEHKAPGAADQQPAAGSTPAAQQPSMDAAMAALDQALQALAANFHKDSFNGQGAPAGAQPTASTLTNNVGNRNNDLFLNT